MLTRFAFLEKNVDVRNRASLEPQQILAKVIRDDLNQEAECWTGSLNSSAAKKYFRARRDVVKKYYNFLGPWLGGSGGPLLMKSTNLSVKLTAYRVTVYSHATASSSANKYL